MYLSIQSLLLGSSLFYSDSQSIQELIYWAILHSDLGAQTLYNLSIYGSLLFILFNIQFKCLKGVNSILGLFKLRLYSLPFAIDGLKAIFNTGQKGCIYGELLKSSCYIKVLQVLRTIPNCPGDIGIKDIKEAGECFTRVCQWGIIYIIVTHSKRSG